MNRDKENILIALGITFITTAIMEFLFGMVATLFTAVAIVINLIIGIPTDASATFFIIFAVLNICSIINLLVNMYRDWKKKKGTDNDGGFY